MKTFMCYVGPTENELKFFKDLAKKIRLEEILKHVVIISL